MTHIFIQRLTELQSLLKKHNLDGYLIPHNDAHQNEYLPEHWDRRTWLCGFDGSNGDLLVLQNTIILWTDSRYTLQAKNQLQDLPIQIIEQKQTMIEDIIAWLLSLNKPIKLGIDPQTISIQDAEKLIDALHLMDGQLQPTDSLVDKLRSQEPIIDQKAAFSLDNYPGLNAKEKIQWLQEFLHTEDLDAIALNKLDDIAWLFNIRGNDIPHCPVCISYALITRDSAIWFVDAEKITDKLQHYCQQNAIALEPYSAFHTSLSHFQGSLGLDPHQASWWLMLEAKEADIILCKNPVTLQKALKTPTEIAGIAQAHIYDAVVLITFMYWLEQHWQQGLNEWEAAEKLNQLRYHAPENQGLSFSTISGFGSNGAIVHYRVDAKTAKTIDDSSLYLVDSGGQYQTGTTDVTRVFHLGSPTPQQIEDYTLVLQGHIDLAKIIFPKGTNGIALDAIARQYLWNQSLNFGHGTGHGVGYFLNVHEGPANISPRGIVAIEPGMVLSNEPGLYREGDYGIRIENLQAVIPHSVNQFGEFYAFQTLTYVPYHLKLIDPNRLSQAQLDWLNNYHQKVYNLLSPYCSNDLKTWLKSATTPLLKG